MRQIVDGVVSDSLMKIFEWNVQTLGSIVSKASDAQEAANAAKAARDMVNVYLVKSIYAWNFAQYCKRYLILKFWSRRCDENLFCTVLSCLGN